MQRLIRTTLAIIIAELVLLVISYLYGTLSGNSEQALQYSLEKLIQWGVLTAVLAAIITAYVYYRRELTRQAGTFGFSGSHTDHEEKSPWNSKIKLKKPDALAKVNQKKTRSIMVAKDYYHIH